MNLLTSTTELIFCILLPHITFIIPLSRSLGFRQQLYGTLHLSGLGFDAEQLKYIFCDQSLYPLSETPQHLRPVCMPSIIFCRFGSSLYFMMRSLDRPSLKYCRNAFGKTNATVERTTSPMNRNNNMNEYNLSKQIFSLSAPRQPAKLIKNVTPPTNTMARDT